MKTKMNKNNNKKSIMKKSCSCIGYTIGLTVLFPIAIVFALPLTIYTGIVGPNHISKKNKPRPVVINL